MRSYCVLSLKVQFRNFVPYFLFILLTIIYIFYNIYIIYIFYLPIILPFTLGFLILYHLVRLLHILQLLLMIAIAGK